MLVGLTLLRVLCSVRLQVLIFISLPLIFFFIPLRYSLLVGSSQDACSKLMVQYLSGVAHQLCKDTYKDTEVLAVSSCFFTASWMCSSLRFLSFFPFTMNHLSLASMFWFMWGKWTWGPVCPDCTSVTVDLCGLMVVEGPQDLLVGGLYLLVHEVDEDFIGSWPGKSCLVLCGALNEGLGERH